MNSIKKYLSKIGRKGGKSGSGDSKRRAPEHYKKMVEARKKKKGNSSI